MVYGNPTMSVTASHLMSQHDWFGNMSWDAEVGAAFFKRLARAKNNGNQTLPGDVRTVLFSGVEGYHFKDAPLAASSPGPWAADPATASQLVIAKGAKGSSPGPHTAGLGACRTGVSFAQRPRSELTARSIHHPNHDGKYAH